MFENISKEKVLDLICAKLHQGFQTYFLTPKEFSSQFESLKPIILKHISSFRDDYIMFLNSQDNEEKSKVLSISKDNYIRRRFHVNTSRHTPIETVVNGDFKSLQSFENDFDALFENCEDIFMSIDAYVLKNLRKLIFEVEDNRENHLMTEFVKFLSSSHKIAEICNFENIRVKFENEYFNKKHLKLYFLAEKNLDDINLNGSEQIIVNVGKRQFSRAISGWSNNFYEVVNNNIKYDFSTSTKNESLIEDDFVHIFILQFDKKRLVKLNINLTESDQTTFIIYKDFEKLSVKNDCEIVITKHHGNEYLVFDTRQDALSFQEKILDIKSGKSFNQRKY